MCEFCEFCEDSFYEGCYEGHNELECMLDHRRGEDPDAPLSEAECF